MRPCSTPPSASGYNLAYGCREGQCSACKCYLLEGEVDAGARTRTSRCRTPSAANGYALMCRAMPESDVVVELLHYDPDNYRLEHAIRDGAATVTAVEGADRTTSSRLTLDRPGRFHLGARPVRRPARPPARRRRRSFSIANLPGGDEIELMIKRYPGGRLSGLLGDRDRRRRPSSASPARTAPCACASPERPIADDRRRLWDGADPGAAARSSPAHGLRAADPLLLRRADARACSCSRRSPRSACEPVDSFWPVRRVRCTRRSSDVARRRAPDVYMCGPPGDARRRRGDADRAAGVDAGADLHRPVHDRGRRVSSRRRAPASDARGRPSGSSQWFSPPPGGARRCTRTSRSTPSPRSTAT